MALNYPLMLDVSDRQIVVVGGGKVAARKVAGLITAGAMRVRVVSPELKAVFPGQIEIRPKAYDSNDVNDAELIFAATDSQSVNDAVVRDANAIGIWVNRADSDADLPGDFSTPAKFDAGAVTVTVSAGSPALAAMIRDRLQAKFDPAWATMAEAMKTLRPDIKEAESNGADRAELFRSLATPEALAILQTRGIEGLKDWIARR